MTIVAHFEPNTLLKLSTAQYKQWFYGSSSHSAPQTFLHDSGGIWFRHNKGIYELWGITSHSSTVPSIIEKNKQQPLTSLSCSFLTTPYTIDIYPMESAEKHLNYGNFLTYIPRHKDWIKQQCAEVVLETHPAKDTPPK